jgi:L-fucose mutarotase
MLRGISPLISPELLFTLARMGHGDELVLADAHFPAHSLGPPVIRADGLRVAELLDAILPLLVLDDFVATPLAMMAPVPGDAADPLVWAAYRAAIERHAPGTPPPEQVERLAFYNRAKHAFAIVMTGEIAKYGNLIIKKGVTTAPGASAKS